LLGARVAQYETSPAGFAKVVAIMLASFACGTSMIAFGASQRHDNLGGSIVVSLLGVLAMTPGALCVYGLTRGRHNALRFHENGIAICKAGQETPIAWDDVVSYTRGPFLVIETQNGDTFDFGMDGIAAPDEIMSRLRDAVVLERIVPKLRTAIVAGEAVVVAGFTVAADGVEPPDIDRRIPWGDVTECLAVKEGRSLTTRLAVDVTSFVVKTAGETVRADIDSDSDADTLRALCAAFREA
jgi:hypothetical protein